MIVVVAAAVVVIIIVVEVVVVVGYRLGDNKQHIGQHEERNQDTNTYKKGSKI
jgi:heme/copper-type cytochrome/quinol oxidase subunit 2